MNMKISIRWTLIFGLLVLIWGTHLLTAASSFFTSQRVLQEHARQIMTNVADLAQSQSYRHLVTAQQTAELTIHMLTDKVLDLSDTQIEPLTRYFHDQLNLYSHFAGIYLGLPNGDFFDVRRHNQKGPDGFRTKIITHTNKHKKTRLIWRNSRRQFVDLEQVPDDIYDPRLRPWYRKVLEKRGIIWTDPYIFFTSQKPGITVAAPWYDPQGRLKGIVGVDLEIDRLSTFFAGLKIGRNGQAFLFNRNADMVAFPDPAKLKTKTNESTASSSFVKINELEHAISRKAFTAAHLDQGADGIIRLDKPHFGHFEHQGQTYLAMFKPFDDENWPWIIGAYMPADDYLGAIKDNRRLNIYFALFISLLAAAIGMLLAKGIIKPISRLAAQAHAVEHGDFETHKPIRSIYKELQTTADTFAHMKVGVETIQAKYRSIFNNIQDIYWEVGIDGKILEISPSVERIYNVKREALIGQSIYDFYKIPQERQKLLGVLKKQGSVMDYEICLRDETSQTIYASLNCILIRDKKERQKKIIGSLRDITARKRVEAQLEKHRNHLEEQVKQRTADLERTNTQLRVEIEQRRETEKALRESEDKYRNILANIQEAYFELDLAGNLTFVNDAACRIIGYSKEELIGMNNREYSSPETAQQVYNKFNEIYRTGQSVDFTRYTIIDKDKRQHHLGMSASLIKNAEGQPVGFRGVARDNTNRLKAENEKRKLEEQLQHAQRMKAIGTLAGGIAHDFNNMLMAIQGNVSSLLIKTRQDIGLQENLKAIEQCVESGADLTRQLLGFARGGKYDVRPIDLNDILQHTAQMFGRTRKEVKIHQDLTGQTWAVEADRSQIEQVLMNLYLNASQAMSGSGSIFLKTTNMTCDEEYVRVHGVTSGKYVEVSVKDTGCGMDEKVKRRIFEPFFTTKEMSRGTGLGLASVFGIVKNHNGFIDVESRPNQGTTFKIYLPATEKALQSEVQSS
jgi:two-component system, cell cycle sensor histidine kinase and response regulator CckA